MHVPISVKEKLFDVFLDEKTKLRKEGVKTWNQFMTKVLLAYLEKEKRLEVLRRNPWLVEKKEEE